jgi:hypothetical protein
VTGARLEIRTASRRLRRTGCGGRLHLFVPAWSGMVYVAFVIDA